MPTARADYDVAIVGGGIAGATLATLLAREGASVLVAERESQFRDRVRGEALLPWGSAELEALGLRQILFSAGATETRWWDTFLGAQQVEHRDTQLRTPGGVPTTTFYHPAMQEALITAATTAGAEVARGVRAQVAPGDPPTLTLSNGGGERRLSARLVVGADGRGSSVRAAAGLHVRSGEARYRIAGVLLDSVTLDSPDATRAVMNPQLGQAVILIPQGDGRVRSYVSFPASGNRRLSGARDTARFVEEAVRTGMSESHFTTARAAGPLATFECADTWVEHPYRDGVVLVGDAAATSDPTWGQGLSMAVRDARALKEALSENDDWNAAAHQYAQDHDRAFASIRATTELLTALFIDNGAEADARRERMLPLLGTEPHSIPDTLMSGPDVVPVTEQTISQFWSGLS